jgi:MFS transporter, DHA2 family, multidrug resistance protein
MNANVRGVGGRSPVAAVRAGRREWAGLAVLALPTLLASMDLTVLHLAVPHLSADLQPSSSQLLWIVDIYGFMVAGSLITMGTLGDRIGRRRLLLAGAAIFGLASVLAAFATSAEMLIATRALLGVAGATLLPSTLALIRTIFVNTSQRAVAIGVWAAIFSAGTAIGPVLGGALLDHFWWGSVFLLGVPAMAALLALGPALLPESRDPQAGRLDLTSAALSLAGVLAVIYGLKRIAEDGLGWPPALFIAAGLAIGTVFLLRQRTLADPLIDLRLFRIPAFSASLTTETLALFTWAGTYLFLAQYLQLVVGLSPLEAGLWLLPAAGGSIVGSMLAPLFVRRMSPGFVLGVALVLAAIGFGVLTQVDGSSGLVVLVTGSVLFSLGVAPTVTLATDMIVGAAPPERAGAASAISETGTELGLALGVAIIGSVGTAVYRNDLGDAIPAGVPPSAAETARDTLGGAQAVADQLPEPLGAELLDAAREAFTHGLQLTAATSAAVAAALAILAGVLLRRARTEAEPEPGPGQELEEEAEGSNDGDDIPDPVATAAGRRARAPTHPLTAPQEGRELMGLSSYKVSASIAVSDMARAEAFYEGKLGLPKVDDEGDGSHRYACGDGTLLHVYASPANAGKATATLATWYVPDLEHVVDELSANGVTFERYEDHQLQTDTRGIHSLGAGQVAWFKDPDGNTFAVEQ